MVIYLEQEKYKQEAMSLWKKDNYWQIWGSWQAIGAYLRDRGRCVYCDKDLFTDAETLFRMQTLDHLLPKSQYPKLERDFWNLATACNYCNTLKRSWDPNKDGDLVYGNSDRLQPLSMDQHETLKQRAKRYIETNAKKRQSLFNVGSQHFREALANLRLTRSETASAS